MKYWVEVEGRPDPIEIEIEEDRFSVNGEVLDVNVCRIGDVPLYSLLVNNQSAEASVEQVSRFRYRVMLGGELYTVEVAPAGYRSARERIRPSRADNTVRAPMPGLVAAVPVVPGESVRAGQVLVVVESMKMENPLVAPGDAIVEQVNVQVGESVDKNEVLLTLQFVE